ncbi:MAG: sensor domain-containing protein, partial [Actinomycetota bacterium]|nr:sensor domain-containing protein [Actinomycetota bacterium]
AAVEAYGTPEEVASSYRESELTVTAALRRPKPPVSDRGPIGRFFGVLADPEAWGALLYMLLAFVTGIVYFTVVVTGISLSLGLLVLIIGVPVALLFLAVVRAVSLAEGRMVEGLLGVRMPRRPRLVGAQGDIFTRIKSWVTDYRTWTTMFYMVMQLPLGITYFTVLVSGFSLSAALIAAPFVQVFFDQAPITTWEYAYYIETWAMPLFVIGGALFAVVMLWLSKGVGRVHGAYAKALLVGRVEGGEL